MAFLFDALPLRALPFWPDGQLYARASTTSRATFSPLFLFPLAIQGSLAISTEFS